MADDPKRSRPTLPPHDRGEDPPPGVYRALPAHTIKGEPIARMALKAPKVPASALDPHQALLSAIAATEGRMLAEISDKREEEEERQVERQRAFEAQLRSELRKLVVHEVKSCPPPPLPEVKKKFEWSHLQYVAAFVVALTGLIAMIINAQKPSPEVLKHFEALETSLAKTDKKIDAHIEAEAKQRSDDRNEDYRYNLDVRSWVTDVLERAASVKIDDPPGTPPRDPLRFYPSPLVDPHKVTGTHIVQPRDPYPVPPKP